MSNGDWKPVQGEVFRFEEPDQSIEGTLLAVRDGNYFRPDGEKSKVYDIKTDSGVKSVFGTMILERQMSNVQPNQKVKIIFKGEVSTKSGRQAKNFEVYTQ